MQLWMKRSQVTKLFGFDKADVCPAVDKAMLVTPAPDEELRKEQQSLCGQQECMAVHGTGRVGNYV